MKPSRKPASSRGGARAVLRRSLAIGLVLLAVCSAAMSSRPASAGDPELAKFLLKGGRDDLGKKQYDDALKKFQKARAEDPSLIEALYWAGVVFEAKKDARTALARYRDFQSAYAAKKGEGASTKDEESVAAKAQARIDVLGAGSIDLGKVQDAYVVRLLAFAQENFIRDPTVTARALKRLLEVRPEHKDALSLLGKLDPSAVPGNGAPAPGAAAAGAAKWQDFLENHWLGSSGGWEYGKHSLTIRQEIGDVSYPGPSIRFQSGAKYVFEAEVKALEDLGPNRAIGLSFGKGSGDEPFYVAVLNATSVVLKEAAGHAFAADRARVELKSEIALGDWHKLELEVDGNRVQIRVDGEGLVDERLEGRESVTGLAGLFVENGKFEVRVLRFGRRD